LVSVFILTSGRACPSQVWHLEKYVNKSLVPIREDGTTILDSQIEILLQNNIANINLVVGYRMDEIFQHCRKKGYTVTYLLDPDWENGVYSSGRTLWEIRDVLKTASIPIITLYGDVVFNQKTLDTIMKCKADVCCIGNSQNIIKWNRKGIDELLQILEDKEMRNNHDGLSYPVWGKLRWNDNITWATNDGYLVNVNNPDFWVPLAEPKMVNKFLAEVREKYNLPQNTRLGF